MLPRCLGIIQECYSDPLSQGRNSRYLRTLAIVFGREMSVWLASPVGGQPPSDQLGRRALDATPPVGDDFPPPAATNQPALSAKPRSSENTDQRNQTEVLNA
jgi:hypothetical protein